MPSNEDSDIWLAKRGRVCATYYQQTVHTLCVKLRTPNLCVTFQRWTEDPTLYTLFSLFFNIPLYARVGNLKPFAHIPKSWTVLDCDVVLGLIVEFWCTVLNWRWLHTHTHTHTHMQIHTPPSVIVLVFVTNYLTEKNKL